jgi:hypothetical protein
MRFSLGTTRTTIQIWMVMLACGLGIRVWAQDSSPPLGDVARKARQEHSAPTHVAAKQTATEDDDGPDGGGVWRMRLCTLIPCYELSITLPKNPKWSRAEEQPRPVLIPVVGHEEDSGRAIRVYAAESNDLKYTVDSFKRTFLQGWFARPEYFGQAARLALDEHVPLDWSNGIMTHFTITTGGLKYRGLSVVAGSPYGNYGFACVFRDEDAAVAASMCDGIIKSARYQELQPSYIHKVYPPYQSPPQYYPQNDDPPDDPPDDADRD